MASWNRIPQKVARIYTTHPLYLNMMATLRKIVTTNLSPPQTMSSNDTKKMNGPVTINRGMKLIPMMLIMELWA
jgi:hypothetical protein